MLEEVTSIHNEQNLVSSGSFYTNCHLGPGLIDNRNNKIVSINLSI